MRRIYTIIFLLSFLFTGYAQSGFNQSFDFGELAANFGSIEYSGETIWVYGTAKKVGVPKQGFFIAQIDTIGGLIDYQIFNDSLGRSFTQVYSNSFIKLTDGKGFVGIGQFFSKHGYIAKFNNEGALSFLKEYPDNNSITDFYRQIIELDDGFLIGGWKQDVITYAIYTFVLKTDFNGNKIWEKKYTTPGRQTWLGNMLILNENEYVIGAYTTPLQGVPVPQTTNTSKIFAIDSLGIIKWQWQNQPSLEELGVGYLSKTPEGYWAYSSASAWYDPIYNEIAQQPTFIVRDENFNLLKKNTFGVPDSVYVFAGFSKALQLNDGGWFGVGSKSTNYPIEPFPTQNNALSGWMMRLDKNAEELWSRVDTAFWSVQTGSVNNLFDAVELPSGSIVACGYSRTYEPAPKDWGWLIKVDRNGCVDTLNCVPLRTHDHNSIKNIVNLYPNPTSSIINIQSEVVTHWDRIEVINMTGQVVKVLDRPSVSRVDLKGFVNGVYFIRLIKEKESVTKRVVKSE